MSSAGAAGGDRGGAERGEGRAVLGRVQNDRQPAVGQAPGGAQHPRAVGRHPDLGRALAVGLGARGSPGRASRTPPRSRPGRSWTTAAGSSRWPRSGATPAARTRSRTGRMFSASPTPEPEDGAPVAQVVEREEGLREHGGVAADRVGDRRRPAAPAPVWTAEAAITAMGSRNACGLRTTSAIGTRSGVQTPGGNQWRKWSDHQTASNPASSEARTPARAGSSGGADAAGGGRPRAGALAAPLVADPPRPGILTPRARPGRARRPVAPCRPASVGRMPPRGPGARRPASRFRPREARTGSERAVPGVAASAPGRPGGMMKIAVCVKEVPDAGPTRRIDPGTLRMDRSGDRSLNAFDLNAVEEALRLKDAAGEGEVVLVSMGAEPRARVDPQGPGHGRRPGAAGLRRGGGRLGPRGHQLRPRGGAGARGARTSSSSASRPPTPTARCSGRRSPTACRCRSSPRSPSWRSPTGRPPPSARPSSATTASAPPLPAVLAVADALNEPRYPSLKGIMGAKKKPQDVKSLADVGARGGPRRRGRLAHDGHRPEPAARRAATRIKIEDDGIGRAEDPGLPHGKEARMSTLVFLEHHGSDAPEGAARRALQGRGARPGHLGRPHRLRRARPRGRPPGKLRRRARCSSPTTPRSRRPCPSRGWTSSARSCTTRASTRCSSPRRCWPPTSPAASRPGSTPGSTGTWRPGRWTAATLVGKRSALGDTVRADVGWTGGPKLGLVRVRLLRPGRDGRRGRRRGRGREPRGLLVAGRDGRAGPRGADRPLDRGRRHPGHRRPRPRRPGGVLAPRGPRRGPGRRRGLDPRGGRLRLVPLRDPGRPDRQGRLAEALHRRRRLGRHPAQGRHADLAGDRRRSTRTRTRRSSSSATWAWWATSTRSSRSSRRW